MIFLGRGLHDPPVAQPSAEAALTPSVLVAPFEASGGGTERETLAAGITAQLIADLMCFTMQPAAPRERLTISIATWVFVRAQSTGRPAWPSSANTVSTKVKERDALGAVAIPDVGGVDLDGRQVAVGVGQDVALASMDSLAGIEAPESPV